MADHWRPFTYCIVWRNRNVKSHSGLWQIRTSDIAEGASEMFYIVCTVLGKVYGVIADGQDGIGWNVNISLRLLRLPRQLLLVSWLSKVQSCLWPIGATCAAQPGLSWYQICTFDTLVTGLTTARTSEELKHQHYLNRDIILCLCAMICVMHALNNGSWRLLPIRRMKDEHCVKVLSDLQLLHIVP